MSTTVFDLYIVDFIQRVANTITIPMVNMSIIVFALLVLLVAAVHSGSEAFRPFFRKIKPPAGLLSTKGGGLESSLQWWEDLAPPFAFPAEAESCDPPLQDLRPHDAVDVVHFCFLVHGYRGYSRDLSYLQTVMQRVADTELRRRVKEELNASQSHHSSSGDSYMSSSSSVQQDVVVYTPTCNERRTDDGIVSGGDRLVNEIREFIHKEMQQRAKSVSIREEGEDNRLPRITISMLGNSLGGLYSRYAIAKLLEYCEMDDADNETWILDGKYRLAFNVFCTTATPHLGVAGHTFLPLPRTAEWGFAQVMRSTGRDLFRCNDLLRRMATHPHFLQPLGRFRERIAYANAYGTDFPVPCQTAGFLNEESDSPHYFLESDEGEEEDPAEAEGLIIAKVYTPRKENDDMAPTEKSTEIVNITDLLESDEDIDEGLAWTIEFGKESELKAMSQTLDNLGWKKVFVDARKNMPKIPLFGLSSRSNSSNAGDDSTVEEIDDSDNNLGDDDRQARTAYIARLKEKGVVESKDLVSAVTAPLFDENFHWPVGHNMIVAFSRSRLSTYLNKAGRPVVDSIAKNLVRMILDWPMEEETVVATKENVAA